MDTCAAIDRPTEMKVARICVCALVWVAVAGAVSEGAVEEDECTSAYNYLAGCLTFVSGPDLIPNRICCGGVSSLNQKDPHCLCTILGELDENPSVNYTKACALPLQCSLVVDVVQCPSLQLPPGYALPPSLPVEFHVPSEPGEDSAAALQFRPVRVTWLITLVAAFYIGLLGIS